MPLNTAVVGAGSVSELHMSCLDANPQTELVAVCDLDPDRARHTGERYEVSWYTDLGELIDDRNPDWMVLCTPVQTHLPLAKQALEAGIPVLIEKPVTKTLDEFEELSAMADRLGVTVSVVNQHLYKPAMREVRRRIGDGELGTIRGVDLVYTGLTKPDETTRGSWVFDLPGGEFEEGLPHPIYLVLGLGGYPETRADVNATTSLRADYERDLRYDEAGFQYVSSDGTICSATMRAGAVPQRLVHVHGERKSLTADMVSQIVVSLDKDYYQSPPSRARNNVDRIVDRGKGLVKNLATFGKAKFLDDRPTRMTFGGHYYVIDAEARAIRSEAEPTDSLERARWTTTILEEIRSASREQIAVSH